MLKFTALAYSPFLLLPFTTDVAAFTIFGAIPSRWLTAKTTDRLSVQMSEMPSVLAGLSKARERFANVLKGSTEGRSIINDLDPNDLTGMWRTVGGDTGYFNTIKITDPNQDGKLMVKRPNGESACLLLGGQLVNLKRFDVVDPNDHVFEMIDLDQMIGFCPQSGCSWVLARESAEAAMSNLADSAGSDGLVVTALGVGLGKMAYDWWNEEGKQAWETIKPEVTKAWNELVEDLAAEAQDVVEEARGSAGAARAVVPKELTYLKTRAEFDDALSLAAEHDRPLMVAFSAQWCGPCHQIAPIYKAMAESGEFSGVDFYKVDVDENAETATDLQIEAMPTFMLIEGSNKKYVMEGGDEKSLREMLRKTSANAAASSPTLYVPQLSDDQEAAPDFWRQHRLSLNQLVDVQGWGSPGKISSFCLDHLFNGDGRKTAAWYERSQRMGHHLAFFGSGARPSLGLFSPDGTLIETIHRKCEFRNLHEGALFYVGDQQYGTLVLDKRSAQNHPDRVELTDCKADPKEGMVQSWLCDNSSEEASSGEGGGDAIAAAGNGVFVSRFNGDRMEVRGSKMTVYKKGSNIVKGEVVNAQAPRFEAEFPWGNVYMVWDGEAWVESGSSNVVGFLANARWEAADV